MKVNKKYVKKSVNYDFRYYTLGLIKWILRRNIQKTKILTNVLNY